MVNTPQHSHLESIVLNLHESGVLNLHTDALDFRAVTCASRGNAIATSANFELEILGAAKAASLKLPNLSVLTVQSMHSSGKSVA